MHLKQLKLAGFKSFVDPTVVPFSSQLVAVVGPNGCGKSNIIDAIRWVMGESSAKNLRGESMADVIFNGSLNRKPVGQASIELVFDNSLGRLQGQYGSYQDIAVKRIVTRDGDSAYYLNGTRCRRRDITDLFLGTGAGARSYSIIGQGTISQLIEAKPEDLRAYLEEAAGVSKYKERRRETVLRMTQTRENLDRIRDIQAELTTQVARLERQATAAKKFKALKHEERQCKMDILVLKQHAVAEEQALVQAELTQHQEKQHEQQVCMAAHLSSLSGLRLEHEAAQTDMESVQARVYEVSTDIIRLEESLRQQQRDKQRLEAEQFTLQSDWQRITQQLAEERDALASALHQQGALGIQVEQLNLELGHWQQIQEEKEAQEAAWKQESEATQQLFNQARRDADRHHVRLQHLEQRQQDAVVRLDKRMQEQVGLDHERLEREVETHQQQQRDLLAKVSHQDSLTQTLIGQGNALQQQCVDLEKALHQAQDALQALTTEHAALTAAQQAALRNRVGESPALALWKNQPRVLDTLSVSPEWSQACEWVVGDGLQGIWLDSLEILRPHLTALHGSAALFTESAKGYQTARLHRCLADVVEGVRPAWATRLELIRLADTVEEALACLPQLTPHESVLTKDGYWFGPGWLRMMPGHDKKDEGLLARKHRLHAVHAQLVLAQTTVTDLQAQRDRVHQALTEQAQALRESNRLLSLDREALRQCDVRVHQHQHALAQALLKKAALADEIDELQQRIEACVEECLSASEASKCAMEQCDELAARFEQLMDEKTSWEAALIACRRDRDATRQALHDMVLQLDREKNNSRHIETRIMRLIEELERITERLDDIASQLVALDPSAQPLQAMLDDKRGQVDALQDRLRTLREQAHALQATMDAEEALYQDAERHAKATADRIQQVQLQEHALMIRATTLVEALAAFNPDATTRLSITPDTQALAVFEAQLLALGDKIKRLGAINLVAIEEYQTALERKQQLDEQYQDLINALATLDAAIVKMDQETTACLKETFDKVNETFQELFPRLFGGGRAMLELTCDNLLEAGVLVMAQPPGKRNSRIQLLSGGEKAMTAVALVFAIFRLNPSPFCMLDEVDAPLDDVNVTRFCELVKEMSAIVQFLFITHNKITMELADHLIGVTMREPGVSRVVAVDVEEALSIVNA